MNLVERGLKKLRRAGGGLYLRGVETALTVSRGKPSKLAVTRVSTQQDFLEHIAQTQTERMRRRDAEMKLAKEQSSFQTSGFCFVCSRWTHFSSSWAFAREIEGRKHVNWREHLLCPHCKLNNRMRASLHLAEEIGLPLRKLHVYATEQTTHLFGQIQRRCLSVAGSEFLGDAVACGACNAAGIMNQDMTKLTFPDGQFDLILSFEVMEHVPNYRQAFKECARILKAGGKMLFSVPFNVNSATNLIRARVREDNTVEHLLPPEIHGDPLNEAGCLSFQRFGWEMLDEMKGAGFKKVSGLLFYSRDYGYMGIDPIQFLAEK